MNEQQLHALGHSPDAAAQRQAELLALIAQAAPELISDKQLDLDKLKDLLGQERIAEPREHYELNWAGKAAARREIQKTSSHTLLPSAGNPGNAPHMLIEGENLEVLRVLQKSYYGKVKMIYIDPPYNTGNDSFVYPDDYSETLDEYQKRTGEKSEAGFLNKQSLWKKNSKESGQYHSAWLSMMYPRLYLARNLLRDDGVIFISIDDNEAANLKLLCDEIFGAENFVGQISWEKRYTRNNDAKLFSTVVDYLLTYRKSDSLSTLREPRTDKNNESYGNPDNDPRGVWTSVSIIGQRTREERPSLCYEIVNPITNAVISHPANAWKYSKEKYDQLLDENRLYWGSNGNNQYPRLKRFLSEIGDAIVPTNLWAHGETGTTDDGSKETENLLGRAIFTYPKPVSLLSRILKMICQNPNDLILDFFAGSGTTAHAVMELNAEDGGHRQCISVQMPEVLAEDSEAYKAGYRTIADITRARIDKVIAKLKAEKGDLFKDKTQEDLQDLACAHFTLAPSNFKVWRGDVAGADALREQLSIFQTAEKAKAVDAQTAMLAELLLKTGQGALGVHAIAKPKQVAGITVHRVRMPSDTGDDKEMWLCFEPYNEALKDDIAKAKPAKVLMLNSCFVGQDGHGADEQLANLQLELAGLDIGLTVI